MKNQEDQKNQSGPKIGIWHAEKYFEFANWEEANKAGFWLEPKIQPPVTYSRIVIEKTERKYEARSSNSCNYIK